MKRIGYLASLLGAVLVSCGSPTDQNGDNSTPQNLPFHNGQAGDNPDWIYNGPLPRLENAKIFASLRAHTVRITGFLPVGWSKPLPPYAYAETIGNRKRITVVYPMATADKAGGSVDSPGNYNNLQVFPWNPFGAGAEPDVPWGGFPFIAYVGQLVAFHGPITAKNGEWFLLRGPVSHGCNRMQGEHVVEFAHLIGINMGVTHTIDHVENKAVPLSVLSDDDIIGDGQFAGKRVDVEYPATNSSIRPKGADVKVFNTWDSKVYPRFVCEYKKARALGPTHCDYKPANAPFPDATPTPVPTQLPTPVPTAVPGDTASARICGQNVAIRDSNLSQIDTAIFNEPVKKLFLTQKRNDGVVFEKLEFTTPGKEGMGWVASQFVKPKCN